MKRRRTRLELSEDCCALCGFSDDNPATLGEKVKVPKLKLSVHYFCLLTSCGVYQKGPEHQGVFGFLEEDIRREQRRAQRLVRPGGQEKEGIEELMYREDRGHISPPTVHIVHAAPACDVDEDRFTERVHTIREGQTLELLCLVTGHPRPQIRWTKTAGGALDRHGDAAPPNDTLRIESISRHQGGRYYCKAENGQGSPALRSIRVDVYYLDLPVISVHQSLGETDQFYSDRTVFLRCEARSNPSPVYTWFRGKTALSEGADQGVDIYEPLFTQGETKILKLKNLRPVDFSEYSCVASVKTVCGIRDKSVTFRLTNTTAPPAVRLLLPDPVIVNPGESVTLGCVPSAGDPAPSLTWARAGGAELPKHSSANRGALTVTAVTAEDGGVYTCIATNNVGSAAKKNTTILVRGLRRARFWITPDPYHDDDHIQIGREVKITCQVEATPPEELAFDWLKNGRPLRSSERMVITHSDSGRSSLDIIDLKFTDFGTYSCVASLRNGGSPEISTDVNISSTTVPPELTLPRGRSVLVVQEGESVDLQCLVSGKPKPTVLWFKLSPREEQRYQESMEHQDTEVRADLELSEAALWESADGLLHLSNVSRDMSGVYRCQTSQLNGFNVRPRRALIRLHVHYPPVVEPVFAEVRQALGRAFSLSCGLLGAHPSRGLRFEWKLGPRLLTRGELLQGHTQYQVRALNREGYGLYTCEVSNEAGAGRCSFNVTGKAFAPEFYYDSDSSLWQNRPSVYGFRLLWTQQEPDSVDRVLAYRLGLRQLSQSRWWEQEIPIDAVIQKGALLSHNLTELVKPESYLVKLTPITRFGEGDASERIIAYTAPVNPHLRQFRCGFEDATLCLCSQDRSDQFDWTRHSATSRDSKYTPNTGPSADHSGDKSGHYLYIETSRPRILGDKARLLTPTFNSPSNSPVHASPVSNNPGHASNTPGPAYCFSFYYHMYGKHIGSLAVFLRQKASDAQVWSLNGNQGDRWRQARVTIQPTSAFQIVLERVRGSGIEGDIAIDDISIEEGECKDPPPKNLRSLAPSPSLHIWTLSLSLTLALIGRER
uniref:MAM domain containing glycosylphosphatidylinositol anchor 2a n=1 Tax=Knipowitschia caucasica TaxID=637954 RepID=A0AAV2JJE0_KNICA